MPPFTSNHRDPGRKLSCHPCPGLGCPGHCQEPTQRSHGTLCALLQAWVTCTPVSPPCVVRRDRSCGNDVLCIIRAVAWPLSPHSWTLIWKIFSNLSNSVIPGPCGALGSSLSPALCWLLWRSKAWLCLSVTRAGLAQEQPQEGQHSPGAQHSCD